MNAIVQRLPIEEDLKAMHEELYMTNARLGRIMENRSKRKRVGYLFVSKCILFTKVMRVILHFWQVN